MTDKAPSAGLRSKTIRKGFVKGQSQGDMKCLNKGKDDATCLSVGSTHVFFQREVILRKKDLKNMKSEFMLGSQYEFEDII